MCEFGLSAEQGSGGEDCVKYIIFYLIILNRRAMCELQSALLCTVELDMYCVLG